MTTNHVEALLKKQNVYFQISGKDFLVKCLNPDHEDTNPSLRIDQITGATHCFSCGFKVNIFKHFGLTGNHQSIKLAKLREKLNDLNTNFNGATFPQEQVPQTKPYRGISAKTLKNFEAFYCLQDDKLTDRLWFPIKDIRNKVQVFVGRHILSSGDPRYLNYPRGVQIPLFPASLETRGTSLILVEGIFDFLNLYDKGLTNVACCFGTNTLEKDTAIKLLPYKAQGVDKIYLMFDGDKAGRDAMTKLQPVLEELGYSVETIPLEDNTDPGEMTQEYVDSIKEYINDNSSGN